MSFISIIFIAIALAMDAFAVAIAVGLCLKSISIRQRFRLSWHFGLFQALMPLLGWYAGTKIYSVIKSIDHWIAFGLLVFVGLHMIKESFDQKKINKPLKDPTKGYHLVILSVSTSIDAFAVGISMSLVKTGIMLPVIIIGIVTSVFTLIGLEIGYKISLNRNLSSYAQCIGGIILLIIGFNIFYQH
jgi:putative Mn2+ efflux pump MntP